MNPIIVIILFVICLALAFYEGFCQGKTHGQKINNNITLEKAMKSLENAKNKHISQIIDEGARIYKEQVFWTALFHDYIAKQIQKLPDWDGTDSQALEIAHKIANEKAQEFRGPFEEVYDNTLRNNINERMENKKWQKK